MGVILLNEQGTPEPSPDVQRRLRGIHPRLNVRFVEVAPSSWAITMEWHENDPRREMVRRGELGGGAAYDIIGYLPMDASLDDAPGYLSRMFRQHPREEVRNIVGRVEQFNATEALRGATEQAIGSVLDDKDPAGTRKRRR